MPMDELIERGRELDELAARIEQTAVGRSGLVAVEGPAGIGKSRLLAGGRVGMRAAWRATRLTSFLALSTLDKP